MPEILIYTTRICPYCVMAKRLLDKKGVTYTEINLDGKHELREQLMNKIKRRTVPQIFINDVSSYPGVHHGKHLRNGG